VRFIAGEGQSVSGRESLASIGEEDVYRALEYVDHLEMAVDRVELLTARAVRRARRERSESSPR
jgi:hypothetical protein